MEAGVPDDLSSSDPEVSVSPTSRRIAFNELGKSGLVRMGGVVYEEYLPQLTGTRGVKKYKEMRDNSAIIGGVLHAVESLMRLVEWYVEPASEETEDLEAAEFIEQCRYDMSHTWEEFIGEITSMLVFGWSYFEIVYKRRRGPNQKNPKKRSRFDDGRIGWRKFAPRSQDSLYRWKFDRDGGIRGMVQQPPLDPDHYSDPARLVFIPIEKSMLFRTTARKNNPEGRSILRNCYRAYHFMTRLQEIEAIGMERNLAGMPIAFVPIDLLADDRTAEQAHIFNSIKDMVVRTKRDEQEGIIFPQAFDEDGNKLFDFQLLSAGGTGSKVMNVREAVSGYNNEIASTMLADFILLGHETHGSFAISSDKTLMFSRALGAWMDEIEATINRYAIPRLMELNDFDVEDYPKVRHGDIESPSLSELGTYVQALNSAGVMLFPDLLVENYLRQAADLPEISPEEWEQKRMEAEQQQAMQQMMGMMGGPEGGPPGAPGGPPGAPPAGGGSPGGPPNMQGRPGPEGGGMTGQPGGKPPGGPGAAQARGGFKEQRPRARRLFGGGGRQ
jgi:hypothetical protein